MPRSRLVLAAAFLALAAAVVVVVLAVTRPGPARTAATRAVAASPASPTARPTPPAQACTGLLAAVSASPPDAAGIVRWASPSLARQLLAVHPATPAGEQPTPPVVSVVDSMVGPTGGVVVARTTWTAAGGQSSQTWVCTVTVSHRRPAVATLEPGS